MFFWSFVWEGSSNALWSRLIESRKEIKLCFEMIKQDVDTRAVLLSGHLLAPDGDTLFV